MTDVSAFGPAIAIDGGTSTKRARLVDRGRVVAELRRPTSEALMSPTDRALERLQAEGVLTPGLPQQPEAYRRSRVKMGRASQELLDAERDEG